MSKLFCDAVNCGSNHERLCCLQAVEVRGENADTSADTCCASFIDAENVSLSAFADVSAAPETLIRCTAEACAHNAQGLCEAQRVQIEGTYAHRTDATFCRSFRPGERE